MENPINELFKGFIGQALSVGARAFERGVNSDALDNWMAQHRVVVAVWPDPITPSGVAFMPIKGWPDFQDAIQGKATEELLSNALPCADREAARALLARYGNPAWESGTLPH